MGGETFFCEGKVGFGGGGQKLLLGGEMLLWKGEESSFWRRKVVFFREKLDLEAREERDLGGGSCFLREVGFGEDKSWFGEQKVSFEG